MELCFRGSLVVRPPEFFLDQIVKEDPLSEGCFVDAFYFAVFREAGLVDELT